MFTIPKICISWRFELAKIADSCIRQERDLKIKWKTPARIQGKRTGCTVAGSWKSQRKVKSHSNTRSDRAPSPPGCELFQTVSWILSMESGVSLIGKLH